MDFSQIAYEYQDIRSRHIYIFNFLYINLLYI
jgi:hypothetical protein